MDGLPPAPEPRANGNTVVTSLVEEVNARAANDPPATSSWTEYPLAEGDWIIINEYLASLAAPIHYGYFCRTGTFVHQVPSPCHELLKQCFVRTLKMKLRRLCSENEVRSFAERITEVAPPESKAGSKSSRDLHQPDIFFSHVCLPRYGIPVEIAYGQKRNRLHELAEFYILKSNRKTRLFIAIDYDHGHTSKVTLRTWRRDYTDPTGLRLRCRVQELRREDSTLIPGLPLRVCLLDLARQELIPPFLHGRDIELSVDELGSVLQEADSGEEIVEEDSDSESSTSDDLDGTEDTTDEEWPFERPGLIPFPQ
ncbi:uncharacterized protein PV07_08885 [Cladophialophora immunda]|uniref:Uncharacterized protein n=1 Tax=Cladophialophora immunda TaxID=569365 RepID=A0A0D2C5G8_9EURO|nr:uncharacterized protein PV07_08885 [Cladophialophora immunda]KIW25730.1 hypothetical protein PV07_08885 [Cladophialophora immunda]